MRVRLVVTGDLEKAALGPSLERALSAAGAKALFIEPLLLPVGMTSTPLPDPDDTGHSIPTTVRRMANALVTETVYSRSGPRADLVVGVDDLELANRHQPGVVTAWLRRAIRRKVEESFKEWQREDVISALRERCSFHLLVPMCEAYFFAERAALTRAGVRPETPVSLVGSDVEAFETDDPQFLSEARQRNDEMAASGYAWWREEQHPKRYLEHLVSGSGGLYQETREGVRALRTLDWAASGTGLDAAQFLRALFEDITARANVPNPLGGGSTSPWTYPERTAQPEGLLLRNL